MPAGGFDNAKMTVRIEWASAASDWDTKLYRDTNGNGAVDAGEPMVGASQQGTTDFEQVSIANPAPGSKYVFRVNNFAAGPEGNYEGKVSFSQPSFQAAVRESWTMTCESRRDAAGSARPSQVLIDRGQRKTINFGAACRRVVEAGRCVGTRGGVTNTSVGGAKLGRGRKSQRRRLRVARLARGARSGIDRYCVQGGGTMRVGYPTKRFNKQGEPQDPQALREQGDLHRLQQQAVQDRQAPGRVAREDAAQAPQGRAQLQGRQDPLVHRGRASAAGCCSRRARARCARSGWRARSSPARGAAPCACCARGTRGASAAGAVGRPPLQWLKDGRLEASLFSIGMSPDLRLVGGAVGLALLAL